MRCSFVQTRHQPGRGAHGDQFQPKGMRQQIVQMQNTIALFGAKISHGEQAGQPAPSGAIARIDENIGSPVGENEPCARVIAQR